MALIENKRPASPLNARLLPTFAAAFSGSVVFIFAIAFVARCTADGVVMPPRAPVDAANNGGVDAGVDVSDAGFFDDAGNEIGVDAGVLVTVTFDGRDAGVLEMTVSGPPFDAKEVVVIAASVVETCAREALRWDPSLGGPFTLGVELPIGSPPEVVVDGLVSPVLSSCLTRRGAELVFPAAVSNVDAALAVRARANLDGAGVVTWSDAAITGPRGGQSKPKGGNVKEAASPE